MFKYWKEMRELKRTERQLKVVLLGRLYEVVQMFEGGANVLELADKMKDVNEKDIIDALVENVTNKEKSE